VDRYYSADVNRNVSWEGNLTTTVLGNTLTRLSFLLLRLGAELAACPWRFAYYLSVGLGTVLKQQAFVFSDFRATAMARGAPAPTGRHFDWLCSRIARIGLPALDLGALVATDQDSKNVAHRAVRACIATYSKYWKLYVFELVNLRVPYGNRFFCARMSFEVPFSISPLLLIHYHSFIGRNFQYIFVVRSTRWARRYCSQFKLRKRKENRKITIV
jgi:hypothetical protein